MHRHSAIAHGVHQQRHRGVRNSPMHQHRLDGIAHTGTLRLGIDGNADCHLHIGTDVDDEVAVTGSGLDDGHLGPGDDGVDEPGPTTRNEQVDVPTGSHELVGDLMATLDELHRLTDLLGQPGTHRRDDGTVGLQSRGRSSQQAGVTGLETDTGGVRGDIGTSLVDDPDDADRHPDLLHLDSQRGVPATHDLTDGVVEPSDPFQADGHSLDPFRGEGETIDDGLVHPVLTATIDIGTVGGQDVVDVLAQPGGHGHQQVVLVDATQPTQHRGSRSGSLGLFDDSRAHGHMVFVRWAWATPPW